MIGLLAVAAIRDSYDCQLVPLRAVSIAGANLASSEIGLPMALKLSVSFADDNPMKTKVNGMVIQCR